MWRKRYLPPPPRAVVKVEAALHPRAICYPWLASSAAWDELRYSLRSVEAHFLDKECPIYILGPVAPPWLRQEVGQRVRFIPIDYSRGNRKGMAEATRRGMQIAEKVLWMNDDIYLLKDCDWDTFEVALTEGCLDSKVDKLLKSKNGWQMGMANAVIDLKHHGVKSVMRFATHTPYLFEREKSLEIFRRFYLPYKGAWETLYHAWHGTAHKPYGKLRVEKLSNAKPQTLFLNHNNHTLTTALREAIVARFPSAGEWETAPPVANGTGLRLCVASHGEDVTWVDLTGIPANIYDATGSHPGLIPVPNEAREASQYLRHIIAKYPDFEDYEIFCQGDPFDHAPLLLDVLRLKEWEGLRFYPIGGTAGSSPEKWMNRIRKARAFIEGFDVHVPDDFLWVPGAQFVVSREALLARPLDWWERLLEKVLLERRYSPWIIERLWLLIFS